MTTAASEETKTMRQYNIIQHCPDVVENRKPKAIIPELADGLPRLRQCSTYMQIQGGTSIERLVEPSSQPRIQTQQYIVKCQHTLAHHTKYSLPRTLLPVAPPLPQAATACALENHVHRTQLGCGGPRKHAPVNKGKHLDQTIYYLAHSSRSL